MRTLHIHYLWIAILLIISNHACMCMHTLSVMVIIIVVHTKFHDLKCVSVNCTSSVEYYGLPI